MTFLATGPKSVLVGCLAGWFVGVRVAGGLGAVGEAGDLGVGFLCAGKEIVDVAGVFGNGVGDEGKRWGEPDSGAFADLGAQHALGAVQGGGRGGQVGS